MIDVGRGQSLAADPDRQPGPARVLALDGQQPLGDLLGAGRGRSGQQLGDGPLRSDAGLCRRQARVRPRRHGAERLGSSSPRSCHQAPTNPAGAGLVGARTGPLGPVRGPGLGAMRQRRVRKDDRMTASGSPVRIRVARASDEAQLARLDRISWSPQSGFPSVIQQAGTVFFLTDSPPQAFLVGEIDGAVVGYIRLGSPLPLPENAHVVAVLGLAVSPDARGRGVATALLAAAEQRARDPRCPQAEPADLQHEPAGDPVVHQVRVRAGGAAAGRVPDRGPVR